MAKKKQSVTQPDPPMSMDANVGIRLKAQRLRLLQLKEQEMASATVPMAFHLECIETIAEALMQDFEDLPSLVASEIVGLTPAEAEKLLQDRIDGIRKRLASGVAFQRERTAGRPQKRRVGRPIKDDQ